MEKANFLFFNYLNYCYAFTHPFDGQELIELVKPHQPWTVEADGFLITSSFQIGNTLKIHLVNLEDRQVNVNLVLPKGWHVERIDNYEYDSAFVHRIYTVRF